VAVIVCAGSRSQIMDQRSTPTSCPSRREKKKAGDGAQMAWPQSSIVDIHFGSVFLYALGKLPSRRRCALCSRDVVVAGDTMPL
jgi:hypothetical protein